MATWLVLFCCLLREGGASQEEAILRDGQRLVGELILDKERHLHFAPAHDTSSLKFDQVAQVRFPECRLPPFRIAAAHRVGLRGEQFVTGEFLALDEKELRLRTAWADQLTIPRAAVVSVTHLPGLVTVFQEDFENDLKAWKLTGQPALTDQQHTSGRHSLRFHRAGQAAEYKLPEPLRAGRAGINFHGEKTPQGAQWLVEAEFGGAPNRRTIRVVVAGEADGYKAKVSGVVTGSGHLRPSPGWHRLILQFTPQAMTVAIDEEILWTGRQPQPGGALQTVRLACVAGPEERPVHSEVCFDAFSLARAVPSLPRPEGDPGQDELWLLSGDQLFGSVPRASRNTIDLRGQFGLRTWHWGQVRGIFLRRRESSAQQGTGEEVRVWLRSGLGPEPDELVGRIRGLDRSRLLLHHETLGELAIDRRRLHRLRQEGGCDGPRPGAP